MRMKRMSILFAVAAGLATLLSGVAGAADQPVSGTSAATATSAKYALAPAKFVHPGCYHNAADLAFMRKKIEAKAEPWFSAFQTFQGDAKLNYKPHAVEDWACNPVPYMQGDSVEAYACALRWSLTGEQAYADQAIDILNAWSSTLKKIHGSLAQQKLVCGWNGCLLANTAELLVYGTPPGGKPSGWKSEEIASFKKMLGLIYDAMKDFQPGFNGNWDAAMMNSMACMGVFLDDRDMFNRAIAHFHGDYAAPHGNGHLTAYFAPSGQCQESARDQGHVQMGLGGYISLCEVAWKQGLDLYGDSNNLLRAAVEYTAKYNLGQDVPFDSKPGFGKAISPSGRGYVSPLYEAAYQHYVFRKGLEMPFTKEVILSPHIKLGIAPHRNGGNGPYRPETMTPNGGICWGTLTMFKGDEDPQAVKKPKEQK